MDVVRSRQRDFDQGDGFTPEWMMEAMLNLVSDESERIGARFLEPGCGSGDGLERVLQRKLATLDRKYGESDFERRHFALLALMCLYGIELQPDKVVQCRIKLLQVIADHLTLKASDELCRAASGVLTQNIVHGDVREMCTHSSQRITFAEWRYLGGGKFQRRDFRFDNLINSSGYSPGSALLEHDAHHELFTPARVYPPMTVRELADAAPGAAG